MGLTTYFAAPLASLRFTSARARAQLRAADVREQRAAARPGQQAVVAGGAVDVDRILGDDVARLREPVHEPDSGGASRPGAVQAVSLGDVPIALRTAAPGAFDVPAWAGVGDHVLANDVSVRGVAAAVTGEDHAPFVGVDHVALDERPVRGGVEVDGPPAAVADEEVVADDRAPATRHIDEMRELASASAAVDAVELDERVGDALANRPDQHAADVPRRCDVVSDE
jgi:hypothetical protein